MRGFIIAIGLSALFFIIAIVLSIKDYKRRHKYDKYINDLIKRE